MRELCANTIYKFVNRFSFVMKENVEPGRLQSTNYLLLPFSFNRLHGFCRIHPSCHSAHSASQHKVNN
ncbi:hypothetical protein AUM89_03740 [Cronobacter sakazakii]|nr:hypothetical protein [Cronobacter sakazakii]EGT4283068.1 hypothetical protein [Cronobacter sakazakii]EGT4291300.1 hypothetical protein [Cronobacter sakazakii]EGT4304685.1 hypothetical protein [Cronobacter sakazakii]EGT4308055.1 hypothetical protein [Cronobacter sakazakii]